MQVNSYSKSGKILSVILLFLAFNIGHLKAQDSINRHISIGIMIGDPIGVTISYPIGYEKVIDISFGPDYFGSPRLQIDKVQRFNTFSSPIIKTYAGFGLALGLAKGTSNMFYSKEPGYESFTHTEDIGFQLGVRTIFGLSIAPKKLPFEIFTEAGPLLALSRTFEIDFDAALGIRFRL